MPEPTKEDRTPTREGLWHFFLAILGITGVLVAGLDSSNAAGIVAGVFTLWEVHMMTEWLS